MPELMTTAPPASLLTISVTPFVADRSLPVCSVTWALPKSSVSVRLRPMRSGTSIVEMPSAKRIVVTLLCSLAKPIASAKLIPAPPLRVV